MPIKNVPASVAVRDLHASVKWYEELLNQPPSRPMPEVAEWNFERGCALQVYQLPERAGEGSFTLAVNNIEEQAARLKRLSIPIDTATSNERVKTIMIVDPDGNHIAFAEALEPSLAR